jgi:pantoate kinase
MKSASMEMVALNSSSFFSLESYRQRLTKVLKQNLPRFSSAINGLRFNLFKKGKIYIHSSYALSLPCYFFGCSAAALLSSITALSELFSLELQRHEIAALAHEAELVHRTGLGDVAASQGGGLACRKGPGMMLKS